MLDFVSQEFFGSSLTLATVLVRLTGALLFAMVIGLEREITKESAGLRTNMMIALAAAALALVTQELIAEELPSKNNVTYDPVRLVQAITAGVAFLAAGVVVFSKGSVKGLTTGAAMWVSASIGLAAGLGFWLIAASTTLLGFIVLAILRRIEKNTGLRK